MSATFYGENGFRCPRGRGGLLLYAGIAVGVWFAAPLIDRIAIPSPASDYSPDEPQTCWNEVMIFLVGTLFVGIGISRLSTILITTYKVNRAIVEEAGYRFDAADLTSLLTTVLLTGFGVILMVRFPAIHRWIQKKSLAGKNAAADAQC